MFVSLELNIARTFWFFEKGKGTCYALEQKKEEEHLCFTYEGESVNRSQMEVKQL
jgi:hypothetical protein